MVLRARVYLPLRQGKKERRSWTGSLTGELQRGEAAARAEDEELRARIAPLTGRLAPGRRAAVAARSRAYCARASREVGWDG